MINQVPKPTAVKQPVANYVPTNTKIGNKQVKPITMPKENLDPTTGRPMDTINTTAVQPTAYSTTAASGNPRTAASSTGGLLGINVTQPVKPASPEFNYEPAEYTKVGNVSNAELNKPYQSNGYSGVQGVTNRQYDPRSESLVENRLSGLLDPNSALMNRVVSQTQEQAASRGLQSSSLAAGAGMGAMIDRATPIAQQDAQTYSNADQLGWQQNFQAEQNNLSRTHDASMFDKQGQLQTELQQLQYKQNLGMLDAQGAQRMQELNAQQGFQASMADLQYRQQLGTLDYQGQQQLQQMERGAQLQDRRDQIMQKFDLDKMDKGFLQDLEKTKAQFEFEDSRFEKQVDAQAAMDYRNSSANAYNNYLEQVALVYSNPNMTPEQQAAGVAQLQQMFQQQQSALQAIYGFAAPAQPGVDTGPGTGPATGGGGNQYNPPVMQPGTGGGTTNPNPGSLIPNRPGGGGGGVIERPTEMIR
ncbi:hypothetical protein [Arsukibacterium indicum]|uniref:Uncharacterized protein n=1 Tax=Arsukibacterium indicum TaxID=2848612 RepID=A0ABS6MH64_9GAMM|nr:hypothetical protein [Arsukibacterium indicum]MBV2128151.1 hypothetical protein [Arsukibacterium indicum]